MLIGIPMSARRVQRRNESLNMQFTLSIALWYLNKVLETIIQSRKNLKEKKKKKKDKYIMYT